MKDQTKPSASHGGFKTKYVFILLAVLAVYSYGWKVTEIDPGELFRDFHLVKPLVKELAHPDLFSREKQSQTTETYFFLTDSFNKYTLAAETNEKRQLVLSQSSGQSGYRLTVLGHH